MFKSVLDRRDAFFICARIEKAAIDIADETDLIAHKTFYFGDVDIALWVERMQGMGSRSRMGMMLPSVCLMT